MVVGKGSDLRQVGDAEHLLGPRKLLQLLAHGFGSAPSDAAVNLVENQGPLDRASAAAVAPTSRTHPLPETGGKGGTPLFCPASTVVFSASITRESSAPEAISSTGPSGSPGLAEMRY